MTSAMPKRQDIDVQLTWNTDLLFPTPENYQEHLSAYAKQVEAFEANYKGKLSDKVTIVAALTEYETIVILDSRLSHYAFLPLEVDKMNTELASLANEYDLVSAKARPKRDFLFSELGQLDEAFLLELKRNILNGLPSLMQFYVTSRINCTHFKKNFSLTSHQLLVSHTTTTV